jgi:pimeloyl-ACP methyl ester carboxylesterase
MAWLNEGQPSDDVPQKGTMEEFHTSRFQKNVTQGTRQSIWELIQNFASNIWEDIQDTGVWAARGLNILSTPSYHAKQIPQFLRTIKKWEIDYSYDPEKRTIMIIPGLSCSVATYVSLINEITKDGKFNVLKLEDFPEDFRAIYSRLSLSERAHLLLDTLEKFEGAWPVDLIGHSIGWPIAVYTKILEEERIASWEWSNNSKIGKIITLSAPLMGSRWLTNLPLLPRLFRSLWELDPNSDFMKKLREEWKVDHRFVASNDEIMMRDETRFSSGEEHFFEGGHFDYMQWKDIIIASVAARIVWILESEE